MNVTSKILKRPQLTSTELKRRQKIELVKPVSNVDSTVNHKTNKRSKMKAGSLHKVSESKIKGLDETLLKNNLKMELATQFISKDKTVRSKTEQNIKISTHNLYQHQLKTRTVSFCDVFY